MTVYLVGAGPGRRDLLTLRAAELLAEAEVVVTDRLVGEEILSCISPHATIIDVGKRPAVEGHGGDVSTHQDTINEVLVAEGRTGKVIVRLKGGDPFLFGRGGEEADALLAAGLDFEVVPGVSSAFALPALAGVPVTHRGVSRAVVVVSGHEPVESSSVGWRHLAASGATIVILMGVGRRGAIAAELLDAGMAAATPVVAIERGTMLEERIVRTTLAALGNEPISSPAVMVIGPVAGFDFRDLVHAPLAGVRVVLTGLARGAGPLAAALRRQGASVAAVPVIEVAPLPEGAAALRSVLDTDGVAWVAVTSSTGARCLLDAVDDLRSLGGVKLATVGPATAATMATAHVGVDLVGDGSGAAALAASIGAPEGSRRRVVFPAAADARPELPELLRSAGWQVDVVPVYETRPTVLRSSQVESLQSCEVAVLTSPSSVAALEASAVEHELTRPAVVAIGPTTADAARTAGFVTTLAASPATTSLVEAVAVAAGRTSPPA